MEFDGPEPKIKFFPHASVTHKETTPGYPPQPKGIVPTPSSPTDDIDEVEEDLEDYKEEMKLTDQLNTDDDKGTILKKLDLLLDRKFMAIYKRLDRVEKEHNRSKSLLKEGVKANDMYWGFDNWRDMKHYGAIAGMAERCYAMIFDAVDYNGGILRDNRTNKRRKNDQ